MEEILSSRGTYRGYDPEDLTRANSAVKDSGMTIRKSSLTYGIPKSTLIDRLHGRISVDVIKSGPTPLFTLDQETLLARHIETMGEVGYGYSRQETINLASDYAINLGLRDKDHPLSDRWPNLKAKRPRSLDIARAKSATRENVDNYFDQLHNILTKYDLVTKPHLLYNIDEKGLNTDHKPPKVISGKHSKAQSVTSGRSQTIIVIGCVNAIGQQIPPYYIFPGARMIDSLLDGATPGSSGTVSPTGWSNTEIFAKYMHEHLLKYLPPRSPEEPVLVLYDGHRSHVSLNLIEWAKSENIVLFVLPPHCSHILQPLDVSCFGPFEMAWNSACHNYMRESGGCCVIRYDVCRIACKVYSSILSPYNIQSPFKKCGIFPFNRHAVSYSQVAPATSFTRDSECNDKSASSPDIDIAENFLQERGGKILQNVQKATKKRNTLSRVVGGKAVTEDAVIEQIKSHNGKYAPKVKVQKKTHNKENEPLPSTSDISTKSSGSGVVKNPKRNVLTQIDNTDSSDEEILESEKCIVCKIFSPDMSKRPYIIIVKWGQCDTCGGWVRLAFCSPVRVLRR